MMPLRAFSKTAAILAAALGFAIVACFLPENPYQRWQLLDGTIHARARWIYERCHFDPTPIDVVFIGPSRTEAGVNAPRLAADLAARGLPANVVNFSLPESGRNISYAIIAQMYQTKRPKLIVLGVTEKPSRFGHSAFKYIAPRDLIVDPGYLADFKYFADLVYLPYRQLKLFAADVDPALIGLSKTFDPGRYLGVSVDTTGDIHLPDGTIKDGHDPASAAELSRGVRKLESGMHPPILPASFADLEFGDERHYVREIAAMARAHGTKVAFVALPYYGGPASVQEEGFYGQFGPIWNLGFLSSHGELFADYGRMTSAGARRVTDWLAPKVAEVLQAARTPSTAPTTAARSLQAGQEVKTAAGHGAKMGHAFGRSGEIKDEKVSQ